VRSVIVAACVAFVLTLFGTPFAIRGFTRLRAAQPIRDINTSHAGKRGTPTMGGVVFIVGTVVAYFAGHLVLNTLPEQQIAPPGPTITGLVLLGLMVFSGAIGFIDDFLKVRKRNSLGLNKRGKLILQLIVGSVFGVVALYFPATNGQTVGSTHVSFIRDIRWMDIGKVGAVVLILAVVMATSGRRRSPARTATRRATPSKWPSSPGPPPGPAWASCGGTPRRPGSSWATPDPWRSAG